MMPALRAEKLTKRGASGGTVNEIDLEIAAGECVGITGAAGSGRTTLLRVLATLVQPSAGELQVDGIDALRRVSEARQRLVLASAAVPDGHGLRAGEYVRFCYEARNRSGLPPGALQNALTVAGIDAEADVASLAVPARRNLTVAVALACKTPIVLVDGAGDAAGLSTEAARGIHQMRQRGAAIVVSMDADDHQLRGACQRLCSLQDGRLVSQPPAVIDPTPGGR